MNELYQETRYHGWDGHVSVKYGLSGHIESCESLNYVLDYIKKKVKEGEKLAFVNMPEGRVTVNRWIKGGLEVSVKEGLGKKRNKGLHNFAKKLTD